MHFSCKLFIFNPQVKKIYSIFFLSVFFLFQYGKMIDYMECRITAVIESTKDCGCDTKLQPTANDQNPALPFHQHHLKNYTEEFFYHTSLQTPAIATNYNPVYTNITAPQQLSGYLQKVLQPPRC